MLRPVKPNTEQHLAEQYLARTGYAANPTQETPEPDTSPRPYMRLAAIEEVQAQILNQLREQHGVQQQAILPDTPEREASYQPSQSRPESQSASPTPPPPPSSMTETLASLHSELDHRQKIYSRIEHQIQACQNEIRSLPSKHKKIEQEHEKRISAFLKLEHDEKEKIVHTKKPESAETAEEAAVEEMRNLYLQYDRESSGVPTAGSVDALFVVIANTEHHLQKAEEATKAAKKRETKLEKKLDEARRAISEMEDEIGDVENGGIAEEVGELAVEESGVEGYEEGEKKPKRGKGVRGTQQGKGDGGGERAGRRRRRRKDVFRKAGKMSSAIALDG